MIYSAWYGPIAGVDIGGFVDEMWSALMQTTKSGKWFHNSGENDPGYWLVAKQLKDRIKQLTS